MTDFHCRIVSLLLRSGWIVSRMRLDNDKWLFVRAERGDYCVSAQLTDREIFCLEWQWAFGRETHQVTDFADILALPIHTPPMAFPQVS
jgi:hypothetical protein